MTVKPQKHFSQKAQISSITRYKKMYRDSLRNPIKFWRNESKSIYWNRKWRKLLNWESPDAKWFLGGKTNISYNCVDRHLSDSTRNKAAIIWEGEMGEQSVLTYTDLHREMCKFANVLTKNGVKKNTTVVIYMPMVPEAVIAMLACTRIGAIHSVVFGGFSANALSERVNDCKAKIIVTADGGYRKGSIIPLKNNVDKAIGNNKNMRVVVLKRTGQKVYMKKGRDVWWHKEMDNASSKSLAVWLNSEHPSFILYTSGSTGKPKGILHTTAGYLLGAHMTVRYVFDIRPEDVYWCTADVGWITGHSYTVYGALSNGATTLMYEGAPSYPNPDRFWQIIDKYKVSIFYTAPTAIRSFMKWGDEWPKKHDLSSLRLLGSVGEPINPEAWLWYYRTIGGNRCPIVDTWWQTETGSNAITTLPGVHTMKPGSAGLPFFGIDAEVVDKHGKPAGVGENGYLIINRPWPSMLRGIYGDKKRYRKQYWSDFRGSYFSGDGAQRDKDGYIWITGRVDDVLNVSGHRIGTAEVESALVAHNNVAEAAVIGVPDEIKGQAIVAFVTPMQGAKTSIKFKDQLIQFVSKQIGPMAKPKEVRFVKALPTTRSGKIMRRLLREIATCGKVKGDITTLEDFSLLTNIKK